MRRLLALVLAAAGIAGGGYYYQHGQLPSLGKIKLGATSLRSWVSSGAADEPASGEAIRIATFNIQVFGTAKLKKPHVVEVLAQVVRRFDVVAIQEIRASDANVIPEFLESVNATGRRYDFVLGPRLGRTSSKEQYAFLFDTDRVEIDRLGVYTIDDPDDLLHREPLVAQFRVRGPNPQEAFTFTLINIHTDPDEVATEINVLDDVIQAVRNDGRAEDDVILLGDLNADDAHYGDLGASASLTWAISQVPTNTRANQMYDNLIFDQQATAEFTGRSGVVDLRNQFQLTLDQALEVSDHCPVWAEFSVYEGGRPGTLASRPQSVRQ